MNTLLLEKVDIESITPDLSILLAEFISNSFYELEEDGGMALEMCEEEDNYSMTSLWLDGTYTEAETFLMKYYNKDYFSELCDLVITNYPNDIDKLKVKMGNRSEYRDALAYECLATILLKSHQTSPIWYTVYGCQENDLIDFEKYHILNALNDPEEFPVMQTSDLAAAMMGVNYSVQPSDMYDVFAYHADSLKDKEITFLGEERYTFTPDTFMIESVCSKWKNYVDMVTKQKGSVIDFVEKFVEAQKYAKYMKEIYAADYDFTMAVELKNVLFNDYTNRFSAPPISLPLHKDCLNMEVIELEGKPTIQAKFKVRGVEDRKSVWKDIMIRYYDVPQEPQELMETIFKLAVDIKVELVGMEAQKATKARKVIPAIEGRYPRKNLSTHGLRFIDDMNVHYKDKRGRDCKKVAKPRFSLALAEKQSLYILKKMLRYSKDTTLSCSFGVDSMVALHLLRRITKNDYRVIFNNSNVEYKETYDLKKQIETEWNLTDKLLMTKPEKSYWTLLEENGWNFDRKGSRTVKANGSKKSNSEQCCHFIKHKPFYDLIDKNKFNINISGLRASESRARQQSGLRDGLVYYAKTWSMIRVNPILFYTDEYVWEYVNKYDVPYSKIYDMKLYYEDVYDNVEEEDLGKEYYNVRTGCYPCMVTTGNGYLQWLKKFKAPIYWHLMKDRGLAKTLFSMNAHKVGLARPDQELETKKIATATTQISLFDTEETAPSCNSCNSAFDDHSADDILENFSVDMMEMWITRRPCTFMSVG
jgi:3'-phosphoadenosine 5'-phosphosulfate sulfotransferase (PAPS reductase)/FAD synthetase